MRRIVIVTITSLLLALGIATSVGSAAPVDGPADHR
jgi:hypothetical protein